MVQKDMGHIEWTHTSAGKEQDGRETSGCQSLTNSTHHQCQIWARISGHRKAAIGRGNSVSGKGKSLTQGLLHLRIDRRESPEEGKTNSF